MNAANAMVRLAQSDQRRLELYRAIESPAERFLKLPDSFGPERQRVCLAFQIDQHSNGVGQHTVAAVGKEVDDNHSVVSDKDIPRSEIAVTIADGHGFANQVLQLIQLSQHVGAKVPRDPRMAILLNHPEAVVAVSERLIQDVRVDIIDLQFGLKRLQPPTCSAKMADGLFKRCVTGRDACRGKIVI
jgi:hypothetical protein